MSAVLILMESGLGKCYESELDELELTYRSARERPIDQLIDFVRKASRFPLLTVGSGGSLTTSEFVAGLHRDLSGKLAVAMTPMEVIHSQLDLRSMSVCMATASGKHADVTDSFRKVVSREPANFLCLCTSVGSRLSRVAAKYPLAEMYEVEIPSGKDGFLATNSLLASVILFARAYIEAFCPDVQLPSELEQLLPKKRKWNDLRSYLDKATQRFWDRETLIVLHGPAAKAAAVDIESKFSEAALGNVQCADYRHFAHGRHHWLAKHSDQSALIAFAGRDELELATSTLRLLPKKIPVLRVDLSADGSAEGLSALVWALHIVGSAGRARGIDPGRPGVPEFGRRIYHLRGLDKFMQMNELPIDEAVAIERKSRRSISALKINQELNDWRKAYKTYKTKLVDARFRGAIFDYDGTICDAADRFSGVPAVVATEFNRLARSAIVLGFATGRGKSARKALRECISERYWDQVVVGYYNGGDLGTLSDNSRPDGSDIAADSLRPVMHELAAHPILSRIASFEARRPQISVHPISATMTAKVWELLEQLVHGLNYEGVTAVRSCHSIDILAPGVSKVSLYKRVVTDVGDTSVLCVGDQGQWPGNDYSLLSSTYSLSVNEVPCDPRICWNLASPGIRGSTALLEYLRCLRKGSRGLRMLLRPANARGSL